MKPKEKKEIFNFLEYNKNILQSYGVKKIGLFGSYVHNQQNKNSDIDILDNMLCQPVCNDEDLTTSR